VGSNPTLSVSCQAEGRRPGGCYSMKYVITAHMEHDLQRRTIADEPTIAAALEYAFYWGNTAWPAHFRSLSVGDVVEVSVDDPLDALKNHASNGRTESRFFLCCSAGWKEITRTKFEDFISAYFPDRMWRKECKQFINGVEFLAHPTEDGVVPTP
jgi:hypothetical protein